MRWYLACLLMTLAFFILTLLFCRSAHRNHKADHAEQLINCLIATGATWLYGWACQQALW